MADAKTPDINTDRNSARISTEDAKHRAESQRSSQDQHASGPRHGGAGKMGMDQPTEDQSRARVKDDSKNRDQEKWPDEDGNLEQSSGHP
ncbi:MAG: hypothetical protein ACJ8MR_01150 [Povalibacter sp.]